MLVVAILEKDWWPFVAFYMSLEFFVVKNWSSILICLELIWSSPSFSKSNPRLINPYVWPQEWGKRETTTAFVARAAAKDAGFSV